MDPLVIKKRQELRVINAEILERTKYKREQEQAITELVESGNTQLMALHHDILLAQKELRDLKTDIRTARQDRALIYEELEMAYPKQGAPRIEPVIRHVPVRLIHVSSIPGFLGL